MPARMHVARKILFHTHIHTTLDKLSAARSASVRSMAAIHVLRLRIRNERSRKAEELNGIKFSLVDRSSGVCYLREYAGLIESGPSVHLRCSYINI